MAVQEKQLTVEAFWADYAGKPYELVEGRVVKVSPSGTSASRIAARILVKLGSFVLEHNLGDVTGADGGYRLSPSTLRAPDVAFFGTAKLGLLTEPEKYAPFAPDLAVEVVSPGDSASEVQGKAALYLEAGTAQVWVVYPERRAVVVHYPDWTSRTLRRQDTLDAGDLLPGFQVAVADLFPAEPSA